MDWFRRNWPDLLIGLALIAVIAGIVATLLTGGSFFPFGAADDADAGSTDPPPAASAPATPGSGGEGAADGANVPSDAGSVDDGPSVAVLPPSDGGATDDDATEDGAGDVLAMPPGAPDPSVDDDDAPASGSGADGAAGPAAPAAADAPADDASDVTPAPGASTPTPSAGSSASLPTEPYRVSVGAFGVRENAQAQAERFRADGFPVFLGTQGDLTLVLVGPYDEEAEALRVADRIRAGDYGIDPVVYLFEPDGADDGASAAPAAPAAAAPTPAAPAPAADPPAPAAGSADGVRLQVGAFGDRASASILIDRLESLGFSVATLEEDGLVKLVIGPFSGQALEDARIVLDGAGIESFAR